MATVRVSFRLGGERFHGRLNRSSVFSDVPAKATRVNRAGPGYKVIRLRGLSHTDLSYGSMGRLIISLRLRQIDSMLSKLQRPLGELAAQLHGSGRRLTDWTLAESLPGSRPGGPYFGGYNSP
jgi:hypothetical protein